MPRQLPEHPNGCGVIVRTTCLRSLACRFIMDHHCLPLAETGLFSKLFLDYVSGAKALQPFYHRPPTAEALAQQLTSRQFPIERRHVLADVLTEQYQGLAHPPTEQIEALRDAQTFTVTTGHQLSIFAGPLFFVLKLQTTIRLAEELQQQHPAQRFVPIFWMATEDHDFAEIQAVNIFGQAYRWEKADAAGPVGHLSLEGIERVWQQFGEMPSLFREAYQQSATLAEATRRFVHSLFGEQGLVVLDADHPRLKAEFAPILQREIVHRPAQTLVEQTSTKLEPLGYKQQAHARPINLFYMQTGLRERLTPNGQGFRVQNTPHYFDGEQAIGQAIAQHPERFSPNVILRGVYQETLLPNLAYIGGPGELAYWLQLKAVFEHYQTPFPILWPRAFALVLGKQWAEQRHKLGLTVEELFLPAERLKQRWLLRNAQTPLELAQEEHTLQQVYEGLRHKAQQVDPTLERHVAAEATKIRQNLANVAQRLRKAEEQKHQTHLQQLLSLKHKLFPGGAPQERAASYLDFQLNTADFLATLHAAIDPFAHHYHVLELDSRAQ